MWLSGRKLFQPTTEGSLDSELKRENAREGTGSRKNKLPSKEVCCEVRGKEEGGPLRLKAVMRKLLSLVTIWASLYEGKERQTEE